MKTLEELRHRIGNVEDVQSIVSTMKTLAAVHIKQYESAAEAMGEYLHAIELGFHILLRDRPMISDVAVRSPKAGGIVFGSDQGLCGKFNEDVMRYATSDMKHSNDASDWRLIVVGNRATQFVAPSPGGTVAAPALRLAADARLNAAAKTLTVEEVFRVPAAVADIASLLQELMPYIEQWRSDGVSRISVYFNRRTSAATYSPEKFQLFPIPRGVLERCKSQPWDSRRLPSYTMNWNTLFSSVVRQYFFVSLYRACAESRASENASRIAAMQTASKNIDRRLQELRTEFNETRQNAITEEILDIATGVEALKDR